MAGRFFMLGLYPSGAVQLINRDGYSSRADAVRSRNWMGEPRGFQLEPKREGRFVDDDGTEWAVCTREGPDTFKTDTGQVWVVSDGP